MTPQEQARLGGRPVSLEAQDLYLKGRFHWQTSDTEQMQKSIEYFKQAIAKDPVMRWLMWAFGCVRGLSYRPDRKDYVAQACGAAGKAMELDENLGEAHASWMPAWTNGTGVEGRGT